MNQQPQEFTVVVKNNIPETLFGVSMADLFGFAPTFIKDGDNLKIQWQAFYYILESKSLNKLFEYRTASNFQIYKRIEDNDFLQVLHTHLLAAIVGFNWHFERNKSFLTMGKSYAPVPTIEQIEEPVRQAYFALNIPSDNDN